MERLLQLVMVTPGAQDGFAKSITLLWPLSAVASYTYSMYPSTKTNANSKDKEKRKESLGIRVCSADVYNCFDYTVKPLRALHSGERNSEFTDDCGKRRVFINFITLKHGWGGIWTMHMGCYIRSLEEDL